MKGVMSKEEWEENKDRIEFVYSNNSYFSELKTMELMRERFSLATDAESYIGEYLSRKWMYNNVFKFSDAEIAAMKKEIEREQGTGDITPDDFGNAGAELSDDNQNFESEKEVLDEEVEPVFLDDNDIVSNFATANNISTKTVSQLMGKVNFLDEE